MSSALKVFDSGACGRKQLIVLKNMSIYSNRRLSSQTHHALLLLPRPKLPLKMSLQLLKPIPKPSPTPPTPEVHLLQIRILATSSPPPILLREWIILQRNEETRIEAIVVLPMLQPLTVHVPADDVDVQMTHAWVSVHADPDLLRPIPAWWDG